MANAVDADFRMISGARMSVSQAVLYLVCGSNKIQFLRVAQSAKPDVTFHSLAMDCKFIREDTTLHYNECYLTIR